MSEEEGVPMYEIRPIRSRAGRFKDKLGERLGGLGRGSKEPGPLLQPIEQPMPATAELESAPRPDSEPTPHQSLFDVMVSYEKDVNDVNELKEIYGNSQTPLPNVDRELGRLKRRIGRVDDLLEDRFGDSPDGLFCKTFGSVGPRADSGDEESYLIWLETDALRSGLIETARQYYAGRIGKDEIGGWYDRAVEEAGGLGKPPQMERQEFIDEFKRRGEAGYAAETQEPESAPSPNGPEPEQAPEPEPEPESETEPAPEPLSEPESGPRIDKVTLDNWVKVGRKGKRMDHIEGFARSIIAAQIQDQKELSNEEISEKTSNTVRRLEKALGDEDSITIHRVDFQTDKEVVIRVGKQGEEWIAEEFHPVYDREGGISEEQIISQAVIGPEGTKFTLTPRGEEYRDANPNIKNDNRFSEAAITVFNLLSEQAISGKARAARESLYSESDSSSSFATRYGRGFADSYREATRYGRGRLDRDLPYSKEIGKLMEKTGATEVKYVEYVGDHQAGEMGGAEWRYVIKGTKDNPDAIRVMKWEDGKFVEDYGISQEPSEKRDNLPTTESRSPLDIRRYLESSGDEAEAAEREELAASDLGEGCNFYSAQKIEIEGRGGRPSVTRYQVYTLRDGVLERVTYDENGKLLEGQVKIYEGEFDEETAQGVIQAEKGNAEESGRTVEKLTLYKDLTIPTAEEEKRKELERVQELILKDLDEHGMLHVSIEGEEVKPENFRGGVDFYEIYEEVVPEKDGKPAETIYLTWILKDGKLTRERTDRSGNLLKGFKPQVIEGDFDINKMDEVRDEIRKDVKWAKDCKRAIKRVERREEATEETVQPIEFVSVIDGEDSIFICYGLNEMGGVVGYQVDGRGQFVEKMVVLGSVKATEPKEKLEEAKGLVEEKIKGGRDIGYEIISIQEEGVETKTVPAPAPEPGKPEVIEQEVGGEEMAERRIVNIINEAIEGAPVRAFESEFRGKERKWSTARIEGQNIYWDREAHRLYVLWTDLSGNLVLDEVDKKKGVVIVGGSRWLADGEDNYKVAAELLGRINGRLEDHPEEYQKTNFRLHWDKEKKDYMLVGIDDDWGLLGISVKTSEPSLPTAPKPATKPVTPDGLETEAVREEEVPDWVKELRRQPVEPEEKPVIPARPDAVVAEEPVPMMEKPPEERLEAEVGESAVEADLESRAEKYAQAVERKSVFGKLPSGTKIGGNEIERRLAGGFYSHGPDRIRTTPQEKNVNHLIDVVYKRQEELPDLMSTHIVSITPSIENEGNSVVNIHFFQDRQQIDGRGWCTPANVSVELPKEVAEQFHDEIIKNPDLLERFYQESFKGLDSQDDKPGMRRLKAGGFYVLTGDKFQEAGEVESYHVGGIKDFFASLERHTYSEGPYGTGDKFESRR